MADPVLGDSLRYWETRRIAYNLALALQATAWVVLTWPHFQSAFHWDNALRVVGLAAIANACYCAAYAIDIPAQQSQAGATWRRRRWMLWLAGTLFALFIAQYWIGDEIYPSVIAP